MLNLFFKCFIILLLQSGQNSFFPEQAFSLDENQNTYQDNYMKKYLTALEEESIYSNINHKNGKVFRFTLIHPFNKPLSIRLEISDEGCGTLFVKESSGSGEYEPGNLVLNQKQKIGEREVDRFLKFIEKHNFWSLTPFEVNPNEYLEVSGPTTFWVIEGLSGENYRIVSRTTTERNSDSMDQDFKEISRYLLKLKNRE